MTERERKFSELGFEYAEGIERMETVIVPYTNREIRRTKSGEWECQPWNDNYWRKFRDLLDAAIFATPHKFGGVKVPSEFFGTT